MKINFDIMYIFNILFKNPSPGLMANLKKQGEKALICLYYLSVGTLF